MLKIKSFRKNITPEIGSKLAGYGTKNVSNGIHDPLFLTGLAFFDGKKKSLLLSYDLLGMDRDFILDIREKCAKVLKISQSDIVITCTHTHSGPHLYTYRSDSTMRNTQYFQKLKDWSVSAVAGAFDSMTAVDVYAYSVDAFENINRRVILPGNTFAYLPYHRNLLANASGSVDPELGMLFFVEKNETRLLASIVNYSAHPLSSQSGGESSLKITSDYPGILRNIVERDLGGTCLFATGACGDLHPKNFESGFEETERMGKSLAAQVVSSYTQALRTKTCKLPEPSVETRSVFTSLKMNIDSKKGLLPRFKGKKHLNVEIHFLRVGDVCFVGVPGELLAEPGLEIKWNSPFRKTYILYNSTDYMSYLPHANAFLAGGYEAQASQVKPYETFKLVGRTVAEFEKWLKPAVWMNPTV